MVIQVECKSSIKKQMNYCCSNVNEFEWAGKQAVTTQFCKMCEKLRGLSSIIFKDSNYKGKILHLLCLWYSQWKCIGQIKHL